MSIVVDADDLPDLEIGNSHIFLQSIDVASGMAIYELYCGQFCPNTIENILEIEPEYLSSNNIIYLEDDDIKKLKGILSIDISELPVHNFSAEKENIKLAIFSWNPKDKLPYRLHTGRELILMEMGIKPLSVFLGRIPPDNTFVEIPEYLFDNYVESGFLKKLEIMESSSNTNPVVQGHRVVLYARTGEEWRLKAYEIVRFVGNKIGWSEPLTRLEGILLGYTEWQNDAFIARMGSR